MDRAIPRIAMAALAILLSAASAVARAQSAAPSGPIDAAARNTVITGILEALDRAYVFPAKAAEMRTAITERALAGAYTRITDGAELATILTEDLQRVSHDKHLRVRYNGAAPSLAGTPGAPNGPRPPDPSSCAPANGVVPADAPSGFGICGAALLPGNIGYVEVRSFGFPPEASADVVARAMSIVADADALVIDIRRNGGGSPHAVRLVSSYLFGEEPVHLNSLYFRPDDTTEDFYTLRTVAGKRYGPTKPVYVLTSSRTFSAAEEFAYNLQARKRATIVGETTGGGAHPGGMRRIGDFAVFVPSGRAINPITKTNWEGTGVHPEIAVPADSALAAALTLARKKR
jgi:retinol-binding protein 3